MVYMAVAKLQYRPPLLDSREKKMHDMVVSRWSSSATSSTREPLYSIGPESATNLATYRYSTDIGPVTYELS